MKLKDIPLDQIVVGKNIRSEPEQDLGGLMESIGRHDVLQPVLVVPRDGKYELVAGHRRLAAMRARNEWTIPAIIRDDVAESEIPYLRLAENIQRKQLSPREVVAALDAIKAAHPGITIAGLTKIVCRSDAWIAMQYQAARTYDELVADGMAPEEASKLTFTDLVELARVKNRQERKDATSEILGPVKRQAKDVTGRRRERRGAYIDYSGGFAIMGDDRSTTIRVICPSRSARDAVLACLLKLKSRRVQQRGGTR